METKLEAIDNYGRRVKVVKAEILWHWSSQDKKGDTAFLYFVGGEFLTYSFNLLNLYYEITVCNSRRILNGFHFEDGVVFYDHSKELVVQ